jgi:SAM-dependent methyltransferase
VAVEPSVVMADQRAAGSAPVVRAVAEHLPFAHGAFDAALAVSTIHHWSDVVAGPREVTRVARTVAVLTFDAVVHGDFWLFDHVPEARRMDRFRSDIAAGTWHVRHRALLDMDTIDGGVRLVVRR